MSLYSSSRRLSPRQLKWLMSFYPPLLFQRIHVVEIDAGFRRAVVRVRKSIMSRNLQGSTFGGTIYAAVDPFHALLLWQICAHEGIRVQAWMKRATVTFLRPAESHLTIEFALDDAVVDAALAAIRETGRFAREFEVRAVDRENVLCATVHTDVRILQPETSRR